MLVRMDPDCFGEDNWKSSIRDLVKVPGDYHDLAVRTPIEEADIVYTDTNGKFLAWLKQQDTRGLLDWLNLPTDRPRTYYIEVKTTTLECDAIFHMSTPQFKRVSWTERELHFHVFADT